MEQPNPALAENNLPKKRRVSPESGKMRIGKIFILYLCISFWLLV
jgi:hypothetical protein